MYTDSLARALAAGTSDLSFLQDSCDPRFATLLQLHPSDLPVETELRFVVSHFSTSLPSAVDDHSAAAAHSAADDHSAAAAHSTADDHSAAADSSAAEDHSTVEYHSAAEDHSTADDHSALEYHSAAEDSSAAEESEENEPFEESEAIVHVIGVGHIALEQIVAEAKSKSCLLELDLTNEAGDGRGFLRLEGSLEMEAVGPSSLLLLTRNHSFYHLPHSYQSYRRWQSRSVFSCLLQLLLTHVLCLPDGPLPAAAPLHSSNNPS